MTDRPILFSAPMVRALLDGRKTQTRRLLPNPEFYGCPTGDCPHSRQDECDQAMRENTADDLRFAVGDRLYVREEWSSTPAYDDLKPTEMGGEEPLRYRADDATFNWGEGDGLRSGRSRASMHMPRWASRLTLTVTDVHVERLNDCSAADAQAEGLEWVAPGKWAVDRTLPIIGDDPRRVYAELWNYINGAGAWEGNPWVVAVSFDVERRNIDQ